VSQPDRVHHLNLLRSAATVSGLTLLSRITGLIRETLTAAIFGASSLTDAFFVAFRLPNLLRRMFAEGAFSQAFVPILAAARETGDDTSMHRLIDHVATVLFWVLVAVSALGVVAAPLLVWAMASGLRAEPDTYAAAVSMTRWMFPYILLISIVSLAAGVLNTWRRFVVPAFTPVLLNLSFIGAALWLAPRFDPPIYALAAGVVIGGIAQLALQVPALLRIGMLPRIGLSLGPAWADPQVRRIVRQMGPAVLAVSVAQISLIINTHIASRIGPGAVSWVSFGDRLMEFPTALLGVALGTVLLPSLARANAADQQDEYSSLLDWGLRLAALLALPCMVGLALMSEPLTALLFHYGRFDAHDLEMTRHAVLGYSVGLIGLVSVKILAPGFYGKQDVRTPFRIGLLVLAVTQGLNLVLVPAIGHAGLTLSISLAALVNAGLLLVGLRRRGIYRPQPGWGGFGWRLAVALGALALLLALVVPRFDWVALREQPLLRIALALGLVGTGAAVYLGVLVALGLRPRQFVRRTGDPS
jgi:putative peptidoglycan lipid II flippase